MVLLTSSANTTARQGLGILDGGLCLQTIDLIPDFIPILGYVDEAILLPIGIWITLKLIPKPVVEASRAQADEWIAQKNAKPKGWLSWLGAAIMILIWIAMLWLAWRWYEYGSPF